ncbi:MAG: c-type cytochrome [Rhodoblastus sp.]
MIRTSRALAGAGLLLLAPLACAAAEPPPPWAYPLLDPSVKAPLDDGTKLRLEGSAAAYTHTELYDVFLAADWFPGDHPQMPDIVARGRKPEVRACGMCHQPNGQGRPENAALAGLPADYIVRQMADFRDGKRTSAVPQAGPQLRMRATAAHATEAEAQTAAAYFSSIPYKRWVRVVETEIAPRTEVIFGSLRARSAGGGSEPIGQRIIEIPEDMRAVELHDPRAGFIAYVPPGAIKRGEQLAAGGGDRPACAACHGEGLHGLDSAPPIAGRSTVYLVRQLYDFQSGARSGAMSELMKPVVEGLTPADFVALAAYVASRDP